MAVPLLFEDEAVATSAAFVDAVRLEVVVDVEVSSDEVEEELELELEVVVVSSV